MKGATNTKGTHVHNAKVCTNLKMEHASLKTVLTGPMINAMPAKRASSLKKECVLSKFHSFAMNDLISMIIKFN